MLFLSQCFPTRSLPAGTDPQGPDPEGVFFLGWCRKRRREGQPLRVRDQPVPRRSEEPTAGEKQRGDWLSADSCESHGHHSSHSDSCSTGVTHRQAWPQGNLESQLAMFSWSLKPFGANMKTMRPSGDCHHVIPNKGPFRICMAGRGTMRVRITS